MELANFSPDSRIWIYQSDRLLSETEQLWLQEQINNFTENWASHGSQLKASGVIFNAFTVLLAVDTSHADSSGCSIDKSVHFIKEAGKELGVNFLDRMNVWIKSTNDQFKRIPFKEISQHPNDYMYNLNVIQLSELKNKFEVLCSSYFDLV